MAMPGIDRPRAVSAVAGAGRFLIAWGDRDGLWGVFADRDGHPSPPRLLVPRVAPPALGASSAVSLAFDGSSFALAWIEGDAVSLDPPIFVARLSPAGQLRDPGIVSVHPGSPEHFPGHANRLPALASNGADSLIVWGRRKFARQQPALIMAARLDRSGVLLDPGGFVLAEGYDLPAVAWDGHAYFVLRQAGQTFDGEFRLDALEPTSLGGLRMSPDGRVDAEAFSVPTHWTSMSHGAAAAAGVRAVVWSELERVRAMLVSPAGAALLPAPLEVGSGNRSVVVSAGPAFALAWNDTLIVGTEAPRLEHSRIWVRALASDGGLGPARRVWP